MASVVKVDADYEDRRRFARTLEESKQYKKLCDIAIGDDIVLMRDLAEKVANETSKQELVMRMMNANVFRLLKAMSSSTDSEVQRLVCHAFVNLSVDGDARVMLRELKAHTRLVALLDASHETQVQALKALANLSIDHEYKMLMGEEGVPKKIISILKRADVAHEGVVSESFSALANLACLEENEIVIGDSGGVEVIVEALKKIHGQSTAREGLRALRNLSVYEPNRKRQREAGAVKLLQSFVVSAVPKIQGQATRVLLNLGEVPPPVSLS